MDRSMKRKVFANVSAQFLGKLITMLTSFIIVKIVSNLGVQTYGDYITAYEFLAFFGIIADAGLFAIAVREMSKTPQKTDHILRNIFSMRLGLIIAVSLIAGISAQFVDTYSPEVKLGIWITSLSMALTIVAGTLSSVLQARMKIQYFAGSLAAGKILLAALIYGVSHWSGIFGDQIFFALLWAGVLSNILFCALVWYFASREVSIRLGWDFPWWKKTFRTSLPYGMALILQTLYLRIDVVIISIILGSTAVGLYGVTTRILESFLILGVFFGQALLPYITNHEHDTHKTARTLGWSIEILLFISVPTVIGITAFSKDIVLLLSSSDYLTTASHIGSNTVLLFLIPTVIFAYMNQIFTVTLVSRNRQHILLVINALALAANAILNLLLIPRYGIIAAAWTTIGCEIFVFAMLLIQILSHYRIRFCGMNLLALFCANGALLYIVYLTPMREIFILAAAVGSLVYGLVLVPFWRSILPNET